MIFLMLSGIKNILNSFLNLIYKQKCLICTCSKTDDLLCKNCLKDVYYLSCFAHKFYKEIPIYSATIYQNTIKILIHKLKFQHKKRASIALALILFNYFKKLDLHNDFIIIYPNSNLSKSLYRGYEHMFLIAKEFSKLTNFPLLKNAIEKIKYTKPQYKARNKKKNIENSFQINKKYIDFLKNKNILLIDDLTTSGATLEEIIDCLIKNDIKNIFCLTIAKTK